MDSAAFTGAEHFRQTFPQKWIPKSFRTALLKNASKEIRKKAENATKKA